MKLRGAITFTETLKGVHREDRISLSYPIFLPAITVLIASTSDAVCSRINLTQVADQRQVSVETR